jgi:hypothetical protein
MSVEREVRAGAEGAGVQTAGGCRGEGRADARCRAARDGAGRLQRGVPEVADEAREVGRIATQCARDAREQPSTIAISSAA